MNEFIRTQLTKSIEQYRENRERLIKIQMSTRQAFFQIAEILEKSTSELLGCVNVDNLADIPDELGAPSKFVPAPSTEKNDPNLNDYDNLAMSIVANDNLLKVGKIENPAIAVIGQVKAGKSTFVNVLLRKNVVCQAFERCTARLTRLQYSEKNFIEIIDKNGNITVKKTLKNSTIPKKYVHLNDEDRNNPDEINKQIVAGINSQFLKCGIDLIDSPGLSENETLDKMSKAIAKNVLPVMIYVIDGRTSVKQTDITFLTDQKSKLRNLQIIYFITKLDDGDDEVNKTDQERIEKADEMMDIAFRKLQHNNLIPNDKFKNWRDCPYFHGASLYQYMDYYKNKINVETKYHFERFCQFEKSLHKFLLDRFEFKINEACEKLIDFQMDVLTKIIHRAQALADFTKENLKQIVTMRKIEEELYEKIKNVISESKEQLKNRLVERLQNQSESIIQPIGELEYPDSISVPENGMVKDAATLQSCSYTILAMVCQSLENIILQFVEEELFENYRAAIEAKVTKRMIVEMGAQSGDDAIQKYQGKSPYRISLERLLASKYKFNAMSGLNEVEGKGAVMKIMESILNSITNFLRQLFRIRVNVEVVDVKSPTWKCQQAKEVLSKVNHHNLADDACQNLMKDFEERHNSFLYALELEHNFVQKDIMVSEETRMKVGGKAPDFAGLLMLTLDVKGRYQLQNVKEEEKIGQGAQGEVFKCTCNDKELAKKTTTLPIDQLDGIAEEVYYSYLFKHPRMLPLEAVSIQDAHEPDTKKISVYSPLKKTDVSKFLKRGKTSFEQRMNIGLQVAEALLYLHNQKIMHRDLKLANILLDENNNVFLADYGFCKSMALSGHSFVGTPVHIAPEIVRKERYDYKVDIFSFGILLWYLAEGSGRHPKFARVQSNIAQVLWAATEHNMRPERLDCISKELWELMENCWDNDKMNRPEIHEVLEILQECIHIELSGASKQRL